jgi:hypothetical protein
MVSQLLTLCTTPVVYVYMDRLRLWFERRAIGFAYHAAESQAALTRTDALNHRSENLGSHFDIGRAS